MTSSHGPTPSRFREGEVIAGKYRIERVLGAGGMGMVVAAFHLQLQQRVAIKLLLPEAGGGTDTLARFAREAQAAARIQSEHVARVIDVAALDDGSPYMVMEFLEGRDLSQVLAARGPLPLEEAVGYVLEACEGVAEAHAVGIVHRDLKPSNLFVCQRGAGRTIVKVLDFGISKAQPVASAGADHALTRTGAVMGSPLYMSPEQMASAKYVDVRTDVWSLAVTLFELLSGRTPFRGESMTELIAAVLQSEPISVREVRSELPTSIVPVIARALEKDRGRRYATVAEFAAAIAPFGPRHASLIVERISHALGGAAGRPLGARDQTGDVGQPPVLHGLAHDVTAEAMSVGPKGGSTTAQPVSSERGKPAERATESSRRVLVAVGLVVAVGGVGFTAFKLRGHATSGEITAEPTTTASAMPAPVPSPPATAAAAPSPVPSPSAPVPVNVSATAPALSPRKPPPAKAQATSAAAAASKAGPVAPPVPASPPASSPACHVVQYLDADGETRFRRECP